jgi:hypothetical protein
LLTVFASSWRRLLGYWVIRRDLSLAEALLNDRGISATSVVAFDRSSGIYAGMLAQRLGIGDYLVLPRSAKNASASYAPRQVSIGHGLLLDTTSLPGDAGTLIVVFHLRTGSTLEAGMEFLRQQAINFTGTVLAIYATPGGASRWPHALCVHRTKNDTSPNENFPWIRGTYKHL